MTAAAEYVLADLDGTLIDSQPSLERAYRWWAGKAGVDPDAAIALMPGRPSDEVVATLAPHLDAAAESARIDGRAAADDEGVVALPGARELLDGHPADRLAIVTSAIDRTGRGAHAHDRADAAARCSSRPSG